MYSTTMHATNSSSHFIVSVSIPTTIVSRILRPTTKPLRLRRPCLQCLQVQCFNLQNSRRKGVYPIPVGSGGCFKRMDGITRRGERGGGERGSFWRGGKGGVDAVLQSFRLPSKRCHICFVHSTNNAGVGVEF